jgi:uncharacterized SAM-binding protein YcdF (DUF218 family)
MRALRTSLRWLTRVAAAIGFLFLIVTFTPADFWLATYLAGSWNDPKGDVLIVMTGALLDERTMGMNSYWRAVYAFRAFEDDHFQEMIVTGGGEESTPIAQPIKDFVVAMGIPVSAVRLETASKSTHESALNMAELLRRDSARYQGRKLILLTSDYHMLRAQRAFQRAGVAVEPRPIPDARKRYGGLHERWGIFLDILLEAAKIAYYWTRGWI